MGSLNRRMKYLVQRSNIKDYIDATNDVEIES